MTLEVPFDAPLSSGSEPHLLLTVVGAAPAWSRRPDWSSSCYVVEYTGTAVALDMGQGSFAALASVRDPAELAAIFISHLHPDHNIDLLPLRHYLRYGRATPGSMALHPPVDLRRRFDELMGERDFLQALPGADLQPGDCWVGPLRVTVAPVTHALGSVAFRLAVDGGPGTVADRAGLVYSGDCGHAADLVPLLWPGDTLLCEAYFGDRPIVPEAAHLNAAAAAWAAREGRAARLILTHLSEEVDPARTLALARREFDGEVLLAEPGLRVAID